MSNFPHLNSDTCFQSCFVIQFNILETGLLFIDPSLFVTTGSSVLFSNVEFPVLVQ